MPADWLLSRLVPNAAEAISLIPVAASETAGRVDAIFWTLVGYTALFIVPITFAIIYFAVKYRRGSDADRSHRIKKTARFEWAWSIVPFVMALGIFAWAADVYVQEFTPPANALEIEVVGKQWMWKVEHPGGQREINELHVPVGRPVKLVMTSQDVIHSFFVPAFRVKRDVLPGRYHMLWFTADRVGEYHLFCAEYCGTNHARMTGRVVVMEPDQYRQWLAQGQPKETLAAQGERLFRQYGCSGCHGENSAVRAPNLAGIYGKPVPLEGGGFVTADETYIRDSILMPRSQVVAGFVPIMPSFANRISEEDLLKIIAYIKSLQPGETVRTQ